MTADTTLWYRHTPQIIMINYDLLCYFNSFGTHTTNGRTISEGEEPGNYRISGALAEKHQAVRKYGLRRRGRAGFFGVSGGKNRPVKVRNPYYRFFCYCSASSVPDRVQTS